MRFKTSSEIKNTLKTKWLWKSVITVILISVVVYALIPMGALLYLVYTYTDYRVIGETEAHTKFPLVWTIGEGKLINLAREKYVFPDDPLEFQVEVSNPKEEDRKLTSYLKIFKGGKLQENVTARDWWIDGNGKRVTDIPIFLKDEGTYKLEITLLFDTQISGSEHPNHALRINNIQVQSLSNKLLAESNETNMIGYLIIFSAAVGGNAASIFYFRRQHQQTKEQLHLTRTELKSRLRADLVVQIGETYLKPKDDLFEGRIIINLKNNGTIPARKIRVSFKDPTSALELDQMIRDEKEIKSSYFPIEGIVIPETTSGQVIHITNREEGKPYKIAIWVQYDYAEVKNEEFIQIVEVNAQTNSLLTLYDKMEIDEGRKRQKEIGF